jgi:hypothetical protein
MDHRRRKAETSAHSPSYLRLEEYVLSLVSSATNSSDWESACFRFYLRQGIRSSLCIVLSDREV